MTTTDPDTASDQTARHAPVCRTCGVSLRQIILGQGHHHDPDAGDVVDQLNTTSAHDLSILLSMATNGEQITMHQILADVRGADVADPLWESAVDLFDGAMIPADRTELLATLINRPVGDWPRLRIRFVHQYSASALGGRDPGEVFDAAVDLAHHDVRINTVRAQLRANLNELVRLAGTCDTLLGRLTSELYDDEYAVGLLGADLGAQLADVARHARAAVLTNREIVFPPST